MGRLYLDDGIIDGGILQREKDVDFAERKRIFNEDTMRYINDHYKADESENIYAMFDPEQRNLLQSYFKNFSAEMYRELNGTVELQIQKKNAKVREKIENLGKIMGKISLDDWEYDGMVDAGQNNGQKCDLCPRPVRYAHFAVNKKTKECLRFGCSCAADFFSLDSSTLNSMKTIQAKTLKDIRLISYIMEHKLLKEYYMYMCGYTGRVVLEKGADGIRDLMTFLVAWDKDNKSLVEKDGGFLVKFGDNNVAVKSMTWIKENIVSCLNADLDDNITASIGERDLVPITLKNEDKVQANTTVYVKFAIRFLELGLPIPQEIAKKLNSIASKTLKAHHPDFVKYAEELLMSHNLAKSSLLRTAFTDFIVNYLASSMKMVKRDEEASSWGIKGQKTFYNTVLTWEGAILKLMAIKEVRSLVNKGLISEEEVDRLLGKGTRQSLDYEKMKKFLDRCLKLFMTNKEVLKVPENVGAGYSKYMIKGVDDRIGIDKQIDSYHLRNYYHYDVFAADTIPINIGSYYRKIQVGYRSMLTDALRPVQYILRGCSIAETDLDFVMYLCLLKNANGRYVGVQHEAIDIQMGYARNNVDAELKRRLELAISDGRVDKDFCEELLKNNRKAIRSMRKDFNVLYNEISELLSNMVQYKLPDTLPAKVNDDFESLVFGDEKTYRDYFIDYCSMLSGKRGNKGIQKNLCQQNLYALIPFKTLEPYAEIFTLIQEHFIDSKRREEEGKLFNEYRLHHLKFDLEKLLDARTMDEFIQMFTVLLSKSSPAAQKYLVNKDTDSTVLVEAFYKSEPLKDERFASELPSVVSEEFITYCKTNYLDTFKKLHKGMKAVHTVLEPEKVPFKSYYILLKADSSMIENRLGTIATLDEFTSLIKSELGISPYYNSDKYNLYSTLGYLDLLKGFDGLKDDIVNFVDAFLSEKIKIERENESKRSLVSEIGKMLDERLRFYEAPIDEMKKKYPAYSEAGLRRKHADFKAVQWDNSRTVIPRFCSELGTEGNISDEIKTLIVEALRADTELEYKRCAEGLRIEMYNRKLIYSHFNITYLLVKDYKNCDLYKLSTDDLEKVKKLIGSYYILKSDALSLRGIAESYGFLTFDWDSEVANIPEPEQRSVSEKMKEYSDDADSTGYTGVQKAELVQAHPDFYKLKDYLRSIVGSVARRKVCSKAQLKHVNVAFEELGLGKPDEVVVPQETNENASEIIALVDAILTHADFDKKVSDFPKKIVKSVKASQRCSEKQEKYVLQAAKELGLR